MKAGGGPEEVNALTGVKCYICKQKGHIAPNCPRRKGKGKAGDKGKGKGKGAKTGKGVTKGKGAGPKGGCWNCGGDHYSDSCPNTGKGSINALGQAFNLGSLTELGTEEETERIDIAPLGRWRSGSRYRILEDESEDEHPPRNDRLRG